MTYRFESCPDYKKIKIMTIKEKIEEKIKIAKADIKVCMDDFNRTGEVSHEYPIGETYVEHSKSEVYHRGRLLGLEEALRFITESE
jgi:hypothetical protein